MNDAMTERVKAVERLVQLFRWERATYLVVSGLALAMLLAAAVTLVMRNQADPPTLALLFGSSGLITISISRVLRMWDQALRLVGQEEDALPEDEE
ncbi:MAG: hypothetical protein HYX75_14035 [Acidobacteria bacterium]|nr:hypothetical protein [Acidobacteriota bacterium]